MAHRLDGKVAIVTGGNSGIGEATGKVLARAGAKGALLARRQDKGRAVQDEIRAAGGDATFVTCDVSDHASVEAAVAQTVEAYGGVRILVNNAGGGALGGRAGEPMRLEDNETWDRVVGTNLTGPFYMTRAVGRTWWKLVAGSSPTYRRGPRAAALRPDSWKLVGASTCPATMRPKPDSKA